MRHDQIVHRSQYAPLGTPTVIALPFMREGRIHAISVRQVGGSSVAFTVDFYNAATAADPGVSSGYDADTSIDDLGSPDFYKVVPQISGTAGNAGTMTSDTGVVFRNRDGGWSRAKGLIYAVITPAAGGGDQAATWDFSFKISTMPMV